MKNIISIKLLSGLLLFTASIAVMGCDAVLKPQDILAEATELIENGKNEAAIDILRPYIYKNNDSFKAHLLAGEAFFNLNSDGERNLYLARHYFSSASNLALNEGRRLQADRAYANVKLIMGKSGDSADILLESADRTKTIGKSGQSTRLYLQAAYLFIQDENYDDAIESCRKGLQNNPGPETAIALTCAKARALFLNEDYQESLDALRKIDHATTDINAVQETEIKFLQAASRNLLMESERDYLSLNPLKKQFGDGERPVYVKTFKRSMNALNQMEATHGEEHKALIGQYALILARHSQNNNMRKLAKQAYEYSRTVFRNAGLEKKALAVGEEIEDMDG